MKFTSFLAVLALAGAAVAAPNPGPQNAHPTLTGKLPAARPTGNLKPNPSAQTMITKPKKIIEIPGWKPGKAMFKGKEGKKTGEVAKPPANLVAIAAKKPA
ncbi:hypothetical protein TWF694_006033 [Orbilia ellipsospora]|uniref:Uncharacterized protein n=1 Tax=Orbilia ellipsospora TaxID=2528407 RepID=A0AAV9WSN4_9PEZI